MPQPHEVKLSVCCHQMLACVHAAMRLTALSPGVSMVSAPWLGTANCSTSVLHMPYVDHTKSECMHAGAWSGQSSASPAGAVHGFAALSAFPAVPNAFAAGAAAAGAWRPADAQPVLFAVTSLHAGAAGRSSRHGHKQSFQRPCADIYGPGASNFSFPAQDSLSASRPRV